MATSTLFSRVLALFFILAQVTLSAAEAINTDGTQQLVRRWGIPGNVAPSGGYPGDAGSPSSSSGGSSNPFGGPGSSAGSDRLTSFLGFDVQRATYIRNIHGILAVVTFVGIFPLGAVVMRVVPGRFTIWIHATLQVVGYTTFAVAGGLGVYMALYVKIDSKTLFMLTNVNFHLYIGLVVLTCLFFQPIFGLIHHIRFRRLGRRQIWSHLHLWTGRIFITLGIINGGLGLWIANASNTYRLVYAIAASIAWSIWVLVAFISERRRDREAAKARDRSRRRRQRSIL